VRFWQGLAFTEVDQLVGCARICEEVGFHGVLLADHVYVPEKIDSRYPYSEDGRAPFTPETEWPEPWAAICAMATATTRLHFNTAVYIAPLRHPLALAKAVGTASILSGGRTTLGVGVGWLREEFQQLGQDFHTRGKRLDEMIEILRKVWEGDVVEHHGRYYDFDRLVMAPRPPTRIPIHIGGASEAALRRAARNDGWIGSGDAPDAVPAIVEGLHRYRGECGAEGDGFEIIVAVTAPPDRDLFHRLEDVGVTGIVSYPVAFSIGPRTTFEQKRQALERYGDEIIAKY
jgi:probable F420-dependent oxidoreductase